MEMSHAYMRETATFLAEHGWTLETSEAWHGEPHASTSAQSHLYALSRGESEKLVLETVTHPDVPERYFLDIVRFHRMRSYSFPLDSWKHFPNRVEFKFYSHPDTNMGLSLIFDFD